MKFKNNELKDSNWRIRKNQLEKLARSGTQDSIATLIQALQDVNDEVAQMAAESLINIGLPAVQPLIATLLNGEWPLSDLAGEILAQMGTKATNPLADLITIPRYTGRIAYVLSQSTDPEALLSLISLLKHEDSDIRELVVRALGSSGDIRATQAIIKHIKQYGASPTAILTLGEIADSQAVPLLIEELKGVHRWFAARALGQIGEPAVEPLIKVLNLSEYNHQGVAVYALGVIQTEKARVPLTEMLKHPDQIVSWRATTALMEIEQKKEINEENMQTLTDGFTLSLSPSFQYFYASIIDELLYLPDMNQFLRTPIPPPFPVPCRYSGGKTKPADFIYLDPNGWLISERLKTLFATMDFTGWDTYPVELRGKNGELIQGYHGLFISGKIGPIDYSPSQVQIFPHTIIGLEPDIVLKGLYHKDHSWDGSDFFLCPDSTLLMVSEPVIKALSNLKPPAKNWIAEPLSEVKRSIKFEKNISFLTRTQKEQLHELRNMLESASASPVPLETKATLEPKTEVQQLLEVVIKNRSFYQAENPVESVYIEVLQDFERLGQSAVDELLFILQSHNREHRAASAWVLGQLNVENAVEIFIKSLTEEDEQVLAIIIGSLGRIGVRCCVPYLLDIFTDSESEYIRCCAAEALGRIKAPQAVPPLLNALPHEGSVIVLCALADTLASLGNPAAIIPLINLYAIGDANLDEHIKQALIKLGSSPI